jgi:hypothetical protein
LYLRENILLTHTQICVYPNEILWEFSYFPPACFSSIYILAIITLRTIKLATEGKKQLERIIMLRESNQERKWKQVKKVITLCVVEMIPLQKTQCVSSGCKELWNNVMVFFLFSLPFIILGSMKRTYKHKIHKLHKLTQL